MGRKSDALAVRLMDDISASGPATDSAAGEPQSTLENLEDFSFSVDERSIAEEQQWIDPCKTSQNDSPVAQQQEPAPLPPAWAALLPDTHEALNAEAASARLNNDRHDIASARASTSSFPTGAAEAARLSTVRDHLKHISPDDSLYFVMCFVERAGQHITADMASQMRVQGVDIINAINDAATSGVKRIEATTEKLIAAEVAMNAAAQKVGGQLRATVVHVLKEIAKDREVVIPLLKEKFVEELTGDEGELEEVKRLVRSQVPEEVRLAIKASVATETAVLKDAMAEAAAALKVAAAATKARANNGWLKNVSDDMKALVDDGRYISIGAVISATLFGGYLLARIVTSIVH